MKKREIPEYLKAFENQIQELCDNRFVSMRDDRTHVKGHLECAEGWWQLILALDAALLVLHPDYKVVQIKEKFGGLRYYLASNEANEDTQRLMQLIIDKFESFSYKICELTGKEGKLRIVNGWWRTLSDDGLRQMLEALNLPSEDLSIYDYRDE